MATTADFKNGMCIEMENDLFQIVSFQHVKPGKGGAFVRTKLKSINTGRVLEKTFNAGEKIKTARVEKRPYQFLYQEGDQMVFMDQETFEQLNLPRSMVDSPSLMKEGQEVTILYHTEKDTPLSCELPQFIELKITYTEPGVKGDTATNTLKNATLETGAEIQVPLFIENNETIKIDTRSKSYVERVKS